MSETVISDATDPSAQAKAQIGVGIIGLSAKRGWASLAHLPGLRNLTEFDVRALSASSPESAATAAEILGVPVACANHIELVNRDDVDLVVISVRVPYHRELVTAAIEAGKNVLCEWPLGANLEESEELTRMAAERGVRAFIGLQARAAPPVRYLRQLIEQGCIGEVLSTTVIASGENWGAKIPAAYRYSTDRKNGATMLTIPFGHTVDGMAYVLGEFKELVATTATRRPVMTDVETGEKLPAKVEDQIAVSGTLESGAVATLHYRGGLSAGTNFLWEINGTEGDIVVHGENGHLQFGHITIEMTGPSGKLEARPVPRTFMLTDTNPADQAHTVAEAYVPLAQDLIEGTEIAPTFTDALRRHRMLDTIVRSATQGERLTVPRDE